VKQACSSLRKPPSRARGKAGIGMAAQPDGLTTHRQLELHKRPNRERWTGLNFKLRASSGTACY
jgi:hypothetical protein